MSHSNKYIQLLAKSFLLSIGLTLAACGGGGDGGSAYPSIIYSGKTSQATVNSSNAADFPITFLEGSASANSANKASSTSSPDSPSDPSSPSGVSTSEANPYAVATDINASQDAQHIAMLNIVTEQIKNNILNHANNSTNSIASGVTQNHPGNCPTNPGSYTDDYNVTLTGFSGSSTFDYFCVGDSTFNLTMYGKVSYSGTYKTPGVLDTYSLNVEYLKLTITADTESFSEEFTGAIDVTYDGLGNLPSNVTNMTVSTTFKANGLTYKIVNLNIDTSSNLLSISGKFYHPTHGFVEITTPTGKEFSLISGDPDKYCGGSLQISGSGGVIDFTADGTCSTFDICFTPTTGPVPACSIGNPWP